MTPEIKALHDQAIAEGYKDEICPACGLELLAHHHFIRCDNSPCPMRSTSDPRTLLEIWADGPPLPRAEPQREVFRCNCPHEVRAGCSEPKCPHYAVPRAELGAATPSSPGVSAPAQRPRE